MQVPKAFKVWRRLINQDWERKFIVLSLLFLGSVGGVGGKWLREILQSQITKYKMVCALGRDYLSDNSLEQMVR